ncbi:hypothetical protein [Desulfocastanea catecholica]
MIGPYTKIRAEEMGIDFTPELSGYAGRENPVGKRFQGLVRWATPIIKIHPRQKAVIASGFSESEKVVETQKLGTGPYWKKLYKLIDIVIDIALILRTVLSEK